MLRFASRLRRSCRICAAPGMLRLTFACAMTVALVLAPGVFPLTDGGILTGSHKGAALAKSAFSPRNSGLEPPGGPKPIEGLPGKDMSRTAEGGMGYTDAYGNTVTEAQPEEKSPKRRPRPGAYGHRPMQEHDRPLPDPGKSDDAPAWNFN